MALANTLPIAITNTGLFQDYYLIHRLAPSLPLAPTTMAESDAALVKIAALWDDRAGGLSASEEDVVSFVQRVCEILGMVHSNQGNLPGVGKQPERIDLTLFCENAARDAFVKAKKLETVKRYAHALAVVEVKKLGKNFDGTARNNDNPRYQLTHYLTMTQLPWGVLTDGARWRIYHRFDPPRMDACLEINLKSILELTDPDARRVAFHWFYAFFARGAFDRVDRQAFLDAVYEGSTRHAVTVQEDMRVQAFGAVEALAQGIYAACPAPEMLDLIALYEQAIILLYRLLFITYAEDREILPVHNAQYQRDYGYRTIQNTLLARLDTNALSDSPSATKYWGQLQAFFTALNDGHPGAGIYPYNGGLFTQSRLPNSAIPDHFLALAIDRLTRVTKDGQKLQVDYRSLQVRHLGSIFEGLLEQQLERQHGSVRLVRSGGASTNTRHRTGSYYTPDGIVEYMVAQTIDALCEHKTAAQIAALRICDPAMGSGHFLTAALEALAVHHARATKRDALLLTLTPDDLDPDPALFAPDDAEIDASRRIVLEQCIYGVDLNPLAVELAKLALWLTTLDPQRSLSFLDHRLKVGDSLVGVALDQIGTLPKKRKIPIVSGAVQTNYFDLAFAHARVRLLEFFAQIAAMPSDTPTQVHAKEEQYRLFLAASAPFRAVADLWMGAMLGATINGDQYQQALDALSTHAQPGSWDALMAEPWFAPALAVACERRVFHWGLEFPDVFFGSAKGFDLIIGNPPYVRQEMLKAQKPTFAMLYPNVYDGGADLFVYFFDHGIQLLRTGGGLAYIASNSWLRADYATRLRAHLRTTATVEQIIDLGDNQVFKDAPDVYPAIPFVRRELPPTSHIAQVAAFRRGELPRDEVLARDSVEAAAQLTERITARLSSAAIHNQPDSGWQLGANAGRAVLAKLLEAGTPLTEYVQGRMYRGVLTGANEVFIIDQATRDRLVHADATSAAIIKPILRGEDLRPWYQEQEGRYVIVFPAGWTRNTFGTGLEEHAAWSKIGDTYPSLAAYLEPHAPVARKRQDQGEYWWELRSCTYYEEFDKPKILWPDIAKFPRFSWSNDGAFVNDKGAIVVPDSAYVLGVLQSRAIWYCISQLCVPLGERAGGVRYQQKLQFVTRLPIPSATEAERESIGGLAMQITDVAQQRYDLHQTMRHAILRDLGAPGASLNQKLTAWWDLDFQTFRVELKKALKGDIPVADRDGWERLLITRSEAHRQITTKIVQLETELNAQVAALFNLTPEEIALIAQASAYRYGEL